MKSREPSRKSRWSRNTIFGNSYFALFSFILFIVDKNNAILSFIYFPSLIRLMEMLTCRTKVKIGNIFLRI